MRCKDLVNLIYILLSLLKLSLIDVSFLKASHLSGLITDNLRELQACDQFSTKGEGRGHRRRRCFIRQGRDIIHCKSVVSAGLWSLTCSFCLTDIELVCLFYFMRRFFCIFLPEGKMKTKCAG